MADRKVQVEIWQCFECDQDIEVRILTSEHPEAPNCFNAPTGCFITCMTMEDDEYIDPEDAEEEFVVFCNAKCASKCLDEYETLPSDRETETLPQ